jgi:hypothetical protein
MVRKIGKQISPSNLKANFLAGNVQGVGVAVYVVAPIRHFPPFRVLRENPRSVMPAGRIH